MAMGWFAKTVRSNRKRKKQEQRLQSKAQKLHVLDQLSEVKQNVWGFKKRRGKLSAIAQAKGAPDA